MSTPMQFLSGVHGIGIELNADCTNDYDIV